MTSTIYGIEMVDAYTVNYDDPIGDNTPFFNSTTSGVNYIYELGDESIAFNPATASFKFPSDGLY